MNNKITLTLLCLLMTGITFAQQKRTCHTMEDLAHRKEQDPTLEKRMQEVEAFTQRKLQEKRNYQGKQVGNIITIPVVVHVLYTNSTNNISKAQILSQIDVLNKDFRRKNTDKTNKWPQAADTQIEFAMATVDPRGNKTTAITRKKVSSSDWGTKFKANNAMKSSASGGVNPWNTSEYLNMWIVPKITNTSPQGDRTILGFAQFPGGSASTDGVVMIHNAFGSTGTLNPLFSLGRTTTHEVGHFLNLRHIWGDGDCRRDDFVADTPSSDAPNYGCASTHSSCRSVDMVQNYMDYSDDACMNLFTKGQKDRMRTVLEAGGFRRSLALSDKAGAGTTPTTVINYCASKGNRSTYEWIDNVELGGMKNATAGNGGYGNFTSKVATLGQGSSNQITISAGFNSTAYTEHWAVWIDFNQDGTFANSEKVVSGSSSSANNLTSTVSVPSGAKLGRTRMRVSMKYNAAQTPCETFSDGEVEDYTVNIVSSVTRQTALIRSTDRLGNESSVGFKTYPNPATNNIYIQLDTKFNNISYKILNVTGRAVQSGRLNTSKLNVSELKTGIYILEINDGQKLLRSKIIKK